MGNEPAFIDYVAARERFFGWDDQFPEGNTDFIQNNAEQTTQAVIFYRTETEYYNDEALRPLIVRFFCWEIYYTGHTHDKTNDPKVRCYKHRVIDELISGLGCRAEIENVQYMPKARSIRSVLRAANSANEPTLRLEEKESNQEQIY